jgi:hypothetical protein
MYRLITPLSISLFFTACSTTTTTPPATLDKHILDKNNTIPKVIKPVQKNIKQIYSYDYEGQWLAQSTSTPKLRKLTIKRINNSLEGQLEISLISEITGNIYEVYTASLLLYIKDGYCEGEIRSLDHKEKVVLYRDSDNSFRLIIDEKSSKFFDTNEIRFIKYKKQIDTKNKVKYISQRSAVLDSTNDILWQDNRSTQILKSSWQSAQQYCKQLHHNGYYNWKLPTRDQLEDTIDKVSHSIDPSFEYNKQKQYWSNSSSMDQYGKAWYVDYDKAIMRIDEKNKRKYIRCIKQLKKDKK